MRAGLIVVLSLVSGCGADRASDPAFDASHSGPDGADAVGRDRAPEADAPDGDAAGHGRDASLDGIECSAAVTRYVTGIVTHEFGPGQSLGQDRFPEIVFGPPKGAGCCQGSVDTVSLGNGGSVTLEFAGNAIVDGAGPDFIVFENAFQSASGTVFAELASVEVSADGQSFTGYPCLASAEPYGACAGWHAVFANPDENELDPLDPSVAGGDAFDLAEIGVASARYVRITDRADLTGLGGVFDLDAVGIVNALCP